MKKPINLVTKLLILAAVAVATLDIVGSWHQYVSLVLFNNPEQVSRESAEFVLSAASSVIYQVSILAGWAALIEIADRIRWQLKNAN